MQVRETTLQELIGGTKQFRVPLFQRTYTWEKRDHARLWRDVMGQYDALHDGSLGPGHFIGSFVLAPTPATATLPAFLVVDGQQRLTTLTLALCALRDAAATFDPMAFDRVTNQYLVNAYTSGMDRWKFVPTEQDQEAYFRCITGGGVGSAHDLISAAYRFFAVELARTLPDLDLALLEQVLVSKLAIVDITAQHGDNVYRIFESLNATGVGLTQADLLRNYLFSLLPTRGRVVYDEVWLPMQQKLGVAHLEGLARVDLRCRGIDVREEEVYRAQQDRLAAVAGDEARVEKEVRDLARRAEHYRRIIDPDAEPHDRIRRGLRFLMRWRATTAHPLVMYLYERRDEEVIGDDELAEVLRTVEGFLVRRLLVGAASNNLNRIFVQLVAALRQEPDQPVLAAIRHQLSAERKYWASDDDIRLAALTRPFFFYGRAEQRRMVLERLEESYGHKELAELSTLPLSVEHVMPQRLSGEWREMLVAEGEDADDVHGALVHTLGNLTLSAYNSELSNSPFLRKQQIYGASHLSLNQALAERAQWTRVDIEARGAELADRAIAIWPGPLPGVSATDGFDWSVVRAAVTALPVGHWTAYGDLAALAGTSAQAVGNHLGGDVRLANAYRVLTWEGRVSPSFRWLDPDDRRDPMALLRAEGVSFDADGRADPERRLRVDDLHRLVDQPDVDDDTAS